MSTGLSLPLQESGDRYVPLSSTHLCRLNVCQLAQDGQDRLWLATWDIPLLVELRLVGPFEIELVFNPGGGPL